jgi:hypothetical protein
VRLTSAQAPGQVIEGTVEQVKPTVSETSRAIDVQVRLDNDGSLRAGGTVNGAIVTGRKPAAVVVPEQSVVLRPAGKVVYVIADGKARQRIVEPGVKQGGKIEIVKGLAPGEVVAEDGAGFLSDGAAVTVKAAAARPSHDPARAFRQTPRAGVDDERRAGAGGHHRLPAGRPRPLPLIEFPVISITTTLKGANPDIVDSSITNVIESAVNSVPGIEHVQSTSSPGVSTVNITFALEKKVDVAFNEVQSKVNQVLRRLPKDVDPPVVAKVETNAQPIMWLALQGDRTQQQLNQYAINVLKKRLETIDGVGEVRLGGRRDRTIRVDLLPDRMAAHKITAQDISEAFAREHVQLAGGFVVGSTTESLVKLDLEFHQVERSAS